MSILGRMSRGTYGETPTIETDGMFPIWLDSDRTAQHVGVAITLADKFGTSSTKISDLYPQCIRTGTLIAELAGKKGMPIPIFRIVSEVTATSTKVTIRQGYGLPVISNGLKLTTFGDTPATITVSGVTMAENGLSAQITITANALGVLPKGSYLVLDAVKDLEAQGVTTESKQYIGVDVSTVVTDALISDGGRIDERQTAGIPKEIWRTSLQTLKLR